MPAGERHLGQAEAQRRCGYREAIEQLRTSDRVTVDKSQGGRGKGSEPSVGPNEQDEAAEWCWRGGGGPGASRTRHQCTEGKEKHSSVGVNTLTPSLAVLRFQGRYRLWPRPLSGQSAPAWTVSLHYCQDLREARAAQRRALPLPGGCQRLSKERGPDFWVLRSPFASSWQRGTHRRLLPAARPLKAPRAAGWAGLEDGLSACVLSPPWPRVPG